MKKWLKVKGKNIIKQKKSYFLQKEDFLREKKAMVYDSSISK